MGPQVPMGSLAPAQDAAVTSWARGKWELVQRFLPLPSVKPCGQGFRNFKTQYCPGGHGLSEWTSFDEDTFVDELNDVSTIWIGIWVKLFCEVSFKSLWFGVESVWCSFRCFLCSLLCCDIWLSLWSSKLKQNVSISMEAFFK